MEREKKLSLKGVEPILIFGAQDAHLKRIESEFSEVSIVARGNDVTLRGDEEDVRRVEKIFIELLALVNRNGELQTRDVEAVIRLSTLDETRSQQPKDVGKEWIEDEGDVIVATKTDAVRAKTLGQKRMVQESKRNDIVFAIGPAGTGKTYTAVAIAVAALKAKQVQRLVLARPAVEAGESLGFLPGDLQQKIDPYLRPLYDALSDMLTPEKLKEYMEKKVIEVVPLAYMRGRTLNNAFIILDEAQNATSMQLKMCLTRLGVNSKAIITGDVTQIDLPRKSDSGLAEAPTLLGDIQGISFVYLDKSDVVRHRLVRDIIEAYENRAREKEPKEERRHEERRHEDRREEDRLKSLAAKTNPLR
ncbi:MAG: PhoH family protein [Chloroherpetonaceae bacterium]|nr:PhoH family protein [Chloroherpetonaceae bacterium]MDW8438261.1 PhoH family protein [Chloroherpetonaceae bacterium]